MKRLALIALLFALPAQATDYLVQQPGDPNATGHVIRGPQPKPGYDCMPGSHWCVWQPVNNDLTIGHYKCQPDNTELYSPPPPPKQAPPPPPPDPVPGQLEAFQKRIRRDIASGVISAEWSLYIPSICTAYADDPKMAASLWGMYVNLVDRPPSEMAQIQQDAAVSGLTQITANLPASVVSASPQQFLIDCANDSGVPGDSSTDILLQSLAGLANNPTALKAKWAKSRTSQSLLIQNAIAAHAAANNMPLQ